MTQRGRPDRAIRDRAVAAMREGWRRGRALAADWRVRAAMLLAPGLWLWAVTLPPTLPSYAATRAAFQPSEAWLYDRHGALLEETRVSFTARRLGWVPLDHIAPVLAEDVVTAEDRRFRYHGGVDWLALLRAAWARRGGGHAQGASTLSMQVAGFLAPDLAQPGRRHWLDKLRQMRAAWALEQGWSKPQILEAYFNLAGYRGEAQGIAAAAQTLFDKPPDALSPQEARLITALLPAPQAEPREIAARACRAERLAPGGRDCAALADAAAAMVSHATDRGLGPGLAPHLATRLLQQPGLRVTATLDAAIQRAATQALRHQLLALGPARARDGAVVVVDNASGDVLAYVGGAGDASTAGAVDGADAPRQAGSTLKPFLYGLTFEKGWLTPASILEDSPVALDTASGLYVPQDYDHDFKGPVSARTALAGSLNVPAVRTLMVAGVEPFRDRLWDLGYHGLVEDGSYYGFSLALGSADVTLLEQANAYRTLANGGRWAPLRLTMADPRVAPRAVMTAQAAWLVGDVLADPSARIVTFGQDSALRLPFWAAVKTGTSKAMRDNWCVGYSERYTVAVWIGNLEGDPMKAVSGTSGAAPVWRDVMMALNAHRPGAAPPPPAGLEARQVQFAGGIEAPRREWFLRGTAQAFAGIAPPIARRPHILSPVSGSVFALDPDIPLARQRLGVRVAGGGPGVRLRLDTRDIGPADGDPLIFPSPGVHVLALVDAAGRAVDKVQYSVR